MKKKNDNQVMINLKNTGVPTLRVGVEFPNGNYRNKGEPAECNAGVQQLTLTETVIANRPNLSQSLGIPIQDESHR
ncbi:hypothetical protein BLOT_013684 [Blomia tropicalis]|nr:hypothetical protein BLOT_013684 [Blomia tropicalis]